MVEQVYFVFESPSDRRNLFSCIRTAELFGYTEVFIVDDIYDIQNRYANHLERDKGILAGADQYVTLKTLTKNDFVGLLHTMQFNIYGLIPTPSTQTNNIIPIENAVITNNQPRIFIIGNECSELTEWIQSYCTKLFYIPNTGHTTSLSHPAAFAVLASYLRLAQLE